MELVADAGPANLETAANAHNTAIVPYCRETTCAKRYQIQAAGNGIRNLEGYQEESDSSGVAIGVYVIGSTRMVGTMG
jgi:hypothetical protein